MSRDNEYFIEKRQDKGDFAIRKPGSERASAIEGTQREAIDRARQMNPDATIHVERVRNVATGHPDKWRKP